MLNKKLSKDHLFKIETNTNFQLENFLITKDIETLAERYCLDEITTLKRINKKSKTSNIFLLETIKGSFILRSSEIELNSKNEFLCFLSSELRITNFINPLKNNKGCFATPIRNYSWIIYPKIEGDIFNGSNSSINKIIKHGIKFFEELEQMEVFKTEESKKILGVNLIDKNKIKSLPSILLDKTKMKKLIDLDYINQSTVNFLDENQDLLNKLFRGIDKIDLSDINLVHNDLNHANILINNDLINFIDLEDICWANKKVAFCHFIFKNLRHMIYSNNCLLDEEIVEILGKIMPLIYSSKIGITSSKQFFEYAILRIFSDLSLITDYYYLKNDPKFMYDCEKKIHNLFELIFLFY